MSPMYMLMYIKGTILFGLHSFFIHRHSFSFANYIIQHETISSRIRVAAAAAVASSVARAPSD